MIQDNAVRYGSITRLLHWAMALLLLWQFASAAARVLAEDTAVEQFLWGTHKPLGTLLLALVIIRVIWALVNASHRPPSINLAAKAGHIALYLLLLAIPAIALLRQYGSGRSFEPFGIPLFAGFEGEEIVWMEAPANLLHSWLGWLLLVMVIGHIAMVIVHRRSPHHEDVLRRMIKSDIT